MPNVAGINVKNQMHMKKKTGLPRTYRTLMNIADVECAKRSDLYVDEGGKS